MLTQHQRVTSCPPPSAEPTVDETVGAPIRREVNLPWVAASLLVLGVLGVAVSFWHAHQVRRLAGSLKLRAEALEAERNWGQAAKYRYLYLQIDPQDAETMIAIAQNADRAARDAGQKKSAVHWYYRALGLAPQRDDLRARLAELLLDLGRLLPAQQQARELLERDAHSPAGLRLLARALYAEHVATGVVSREEAVAALEAAQQAAPADLETALALAHAYRAGDPGLPDAQRRRQADAVLDALVAAAPDNARAYLARFGHRRQAGHSGAAADLAQALRLAPDDVTVLLAAAEEAERTDQLAEAQQHYQRVIEAAPDDDRGYLGAGGCLLGGHQPVQAIAVWQRGLARVQAGGTTLKLRIAETQVALGQLESARQMLDEVRAELASRAGQLERDAAPAVTELIEARWLLARGQRLPAIDRLKQLVLGTSSAAGDALERSVRQQALRLLAETYAQLHQWDAAAAACDQASAERPDSAEALQAAGRAWARAGDLERAVQRCQQVLALPDAPAEARLELAQLQLELQLRRPPNQRTWGAAERALEKCDPQRPATALVRARLTLARGGAAAGEQAVDILQAAEASQPEDADFCRSAVVLYDQLGRRQDADRALDRFARLAHPVEAAVVRADVLARRGDAQGAERQLQLARGQADAAQKRRLAYAQLALWRSRGDHQRARDLLAGLLESSSQDVGLVHQAAELSRARGARAEQQRWETRLRELEGEDGVYWRLHQARRLLAAPSGDQPSSLAQVARLQEEIQQRRPAWVENHLLQAELAERRQQRDEAIEAYRLALLHGAPLGAVQEQLARLLAQAPHPQPQHVAALADLLLRRDAPQEVAELLAQIEQAAPDAPLAIELRCRWLKAVDRFGEIAPLLEPYAARALAQPRSDAEAEALVAWVAGLYRQLEMYDEAESWYRQLARRSSARRDAAALELARMGRTRAAVEVVLAAAPQVVEAPVVRGLAAVLLAGAVDAAADQLVEPLLAAAVTRFPEDGELLFAISHVRLKQQRINDAILLLRRVITLTPENFLAWNNLAAVLAERPEARDEALALIAEALQRAPTRMPTLLDTKAFILLTRGEHQEALVILREVVEMPEGTDPRFWLHLAIACQRTGGAAEAQQALEQAQQRGLSRTYLTPYEQRLHAELAAQLTPEPAGS